jgi:hypothetical protein
VSIYYLTTFKILLFSHNFIHPILKLNYKYLYILILYHK